MDFLQVDVFSNGPFTGNPLAVFPDPAGLSATQMQAIAREMNLSETTFVTSAREDSYDVRIFTPAEELPFAGHPTLGTAWALRRLGRVGGDAVTQNSAAGPTPVRASGDLMWFERPGTAQADLAATDPAVTKAIADALGIEPGAVGLEAREMGRSGLLEPAHAEAGITILLVPLKDIDALGRCRPDPAALSQFAGDGAYCFTAAGAGRLRARGFFPGVGIEEDPATGAAAAALGIYLADRVGTIDAEIAQGIEMGRPSRIHVKGSERRVEIGGRVDPVFTGVLESLPPE